MKRTMKKLLCAVLAAATLGTCSMGVSAEESYLLGDVNKDGVVDTDDSALVLVEYLRVVVMSDKGTFSEEEIVLGDVDGDGVVHCIDSQWILDYYLHTMMYGDATPLEEYIRDQLDLTLEEYLAYRESLKPYYEQCHEESKKSFEDLGYMQY